MRLRIALMALAGSLYLAWANTSSSWAQVVTPEAGDRTESTGNVVRVGVREVPPFAFLDPEGQWIGLSIGIWEQIARERNIAFTYVPMSLPQMLEGLDQGDIDLVAAALTKTSEREERFDFSHTYLTSGLAIAAQDKTQSPIGQLWEILIGEQFGLWILGFLTFSLIPATLIVLCERRIQPNEFGGPWLHSFWQGLWWAVVTMTTVGYGDKAPRSVAGRAIAIIWMFAGIVIVSSFTAIVASNVSILQMDRQLGGLNDLTGKRIGTIGGSTAQDLLLDREISVKAYSKVERMLEDLVTDQLDAVVYDEPILGYLLQRNPNYEDLLLIRTVLVRQDYAFGLATDQPELREQLNRGLLKLLATPVAERLRRQYLGR